MKRWLRVDARNRAFRTTLQGIAAVVAFAAGDAIIQVVQGALVDAATTGGIDWRQVATTAAYAAGTAALMAISAYLHRARLDPSPIPSAQPPTPPHTPPEMAPASRGPLED